VAAVLAGFWFSIASEASIAGLDSPLGLAVIGPPLALATAWLALRRRPARPPAKESFVDAASGVLLIGAGIFLVWAQPGPGGWDYWAQRYDLVGLDLFALGAACWLFGLAAVWRARAGVAVLLLCSPPVLIWLQAQVAPPLAVVTSDVARPLAAFLGTTYAPATDPAIFTSAWHGLAYQITIGDVCSGLASGISVLLVGIPGSIYLGLGRARLLAWLAVGISAAIVANLLRVVVLLIAAQHFGPAFALGVLHPWLGAALLLLIFLGLFLIPHGIPLPAAPAALLGPVTRVAIAAVLVAALVGAGAQSRLLPYRDLSGGGPPGPSVTDPIAIAPQIPGWNLTLRREIAWQDLFGVDSRSYLMNYAAAGESPVTLQLVTTPESGRLYTYTPERCGIYHGDQVRGARSVDLGLGQTGQLVDTIELVPPSVAAGPSTPGTLRPLRLSILYWYVPFTVGDRTFTARFSLILDADAESTMAGASPPAGLAPGGRPFDRVDASMVSLGSSITAKLAGGRP
jgi:exosortase/archaeosortase family protein